MKSITVVDVAKYFVNSCMFRYGPPVNLIAENGGSVTSKFLIDVCWIMQIQNNFEIIYHSQANDS